MVSVFRKYFDPNIDLFFITLENSKLEINITMEFSNVYKDNF